MPFLPLILLMQNDTLPSLTRNRLLGLTLILGTILLYLPTIFFQFIYYDDSEYVFENSHVLAGVFSPVFLKWFLSANVSANWHPLTLVSHAIDTQLFGLWPGGHHLTSVLFHAANALLVFVLFSRMTKSPGKSFLLAALFAWHPVKIESVAWIAERKDVLSTFFILLSMLAYVRNMRNQEPGTKNQENQTLLHGSWSLVLFALSLLCKSMYVTLPAILLLFDFWPLQRKESWLTLLKEKIPFVVISLIACGVTLWAQSSGGAIHSMVADSLSMRLANISQSYSDYILLFVWPSKLAFFYPYFPNTSVLFSLALGGGLILISAVLFIGIKKIPALWVGWMIFIVSLLPVIGIITIGAQRMACRYLYWPATGLSILLIWGVAAGLKKISAPKKLVQILAACVLLGYISITAINLRYWQNSYQLFQRAVDIVPNNWLAHANLRAAYGRDGKHVQAAEHLIEAIRIYPDVFRLIPIHWLDFYFMGKVYWDQGKLPQAESFLRVAGQKLAQEKTENILENSKTERDKLAACLKAFDASDSKACVL